MYLSAYLQKEKYRIRKEFKTTLKQQILVLNTFLIIDGSLFIVYIYIFGFGFPYKAFIFAWSLVFVLTILPVLILHTQYYIKNYKAVFTIDKLNKTFNYVSPKINIAASFDDIESRHYYGSYAENSGMYTFGPYCFFKIILKDKREIIVTTLMMYNSKKIMEELLSIKAEGHLGILALLPFKKKR